MPSPSISDIISVGGGASTASEALYNKDNIGQALGDIAMGSPSAPDTLWEMASIDASHWNKSFPYQLVVLKRSGNNYLMQDKFTLPISPTELSISSPFAITTSVTLGGIVEEHNGSPVKMISIRGSTGLLPLKGSPDVSQSLGGLVNRIHGGSLAGLATIGAGARQVVSGGKNLNQPNLVSDSDPVILQGSGYYQFTLLRNFLEAYVSLKKTKAGTDYRLAFMIWKDSEAWLVSPVSFDLQRSASSALEYMYSIQLKAWKRWSPGSGQQPASFQNKPAVRSPNVLSAALNSLRGARNVLLGAKQVITGFRGDVDNTLFLPLRETAMFIKGLIGVGLTLQDLPVEILRDAKDSIVQFVSSTDAAPGLSSNASEAELAEAKQLLKDLGVLTGTVETGADPIPHGSGPMGRKGPPSGVAHPAHELFFNPSKYFELFDSIQVGQLSLKPSTIKRIVQEKDRTSKLTRLDFETFRDNVIKLAADYADFVGAGATTFSSVYHRPAPVATRTPTEDDWDVIYNLNQVAMEYNRLAASTATDSRNKLSAMEYIAGQAQLSGIPFEVPASAFAVPFPYGSTLEVLANRYLGTPDRWNEIAVLNNLRPPYVDEEGFTLPLLVNGSANSVQVADGTNLYPQQPVWLASGTVSREKRRVSAVRKLSATVWVVDLDGDGDLSKFTTANGAELFAFLPGTANSLQLIYIPSDQPPAKPDYEPKGNETLDEFEAFLQVGGVDFLLTDRGDLAITKDGDQKLSIGLANIVQHVKIVLGIEPDTLLHHPDVGFAVRPGSSTADVSAKDILRAAQQSFSKDPTFTGIGAASIVKNGPTLSISLSLGVAGISHYIPVAFTLPA